MGVVTRVLLCSYIDVLKDWLFFKANGSQKIWCLSCLLIWTFCSIFSLLVVNVQKDSLCQLSFCALVPIFYDLEVAGIAILLEQTKSRGSRLKNRARIVWTGGFVSITEGAVLKRITPVVLCERCGLNLSLQHVNADAWRGMP